MSLGPTSRNGGLRAANPIPSRSRHAAAASTMARGIGLLAVVSSGLYFVSDVVETLQDGFSTGQLWLTLVAEATLPVFVVGLAIVQQPRLGRAGMLSAVAYAYSYVFFSGTVVYALVHATKDYSTLTAELGAVMTIHGAVMVLAGLGFGIAVLRAHVLPAWTAVALILGVLLVAIAQDMPEGAQLTATGVRDLAFIGMGIVVSRRARSPRRHTHN